MSVGTYFVAYQGGTLVETPIGGGNYAYINVLGTGVATVQAHTYFA